MAFGCTTELGRVVFIPKGYKLTNAKVWAVDPRRGDLYIVCVFEGTNQFVRVSEGIVDDPRQVMNTNMKVLCDAVGAVVALPIESGEHYVTCEPMPSPEWYLFQ